MIAELIILFLCFLSLYTLINNNIRNCLLAEIEKELTKMKKEDKKEK